MAHLAAGTDSLTGLLNRAGFSERIENEFNRGSRMGGVLAIGFIDCDNFKSSTTPAVTWRAMNF